MSQRLSPEERTKLEMEAGRRQVALYGMLEKVDAGTAKLRYAFPALKIDTVINQPYTHVTIRAGTKHQNIMFEDLLDDYPSDHLVAKLALIA